MAWLQGNCSTPIPDAASAGLSGAPMLPPKPGQCLVTFGSSVFKLANSQSQTLWVDGLYLRHLPQEGQGSDTTVVSIPGAATEAGPLAYFTNTTIQGTGSGSLRALLNKGRTYMEGAQAPCTSAQATCAHMHALHAWTPSSTVMEHSCSGQNPCMHCPQRHVLGRLTTRLTRHVSRVVGAPGGHMRFRDLEPWHDAGCLFVDLSYAGAEYSSANSPIRMTLESAVSVFKRCTFQNCVNPEGLIVLAKSAVVVEGCVFMHNTFTNPEVWSDDGQIYSDSELPVWNSRSKTLGAAAPVEAATSPALAEVANAKGLQGIQQVCMPVNDMPLPAPVGSPRQSACAGAGRVMTGCVTENDMPSRT